MGSDIDPKVDYVFKALCGDEDNALLLVDLLNAVLRFPAGKVVRGVTLLNPFVAKDYAEGKVSILDVRARDDVGRQFLVEMQRFVRVGLAKRLVFYWAGGHAEQLFKGDRYEMLQPTYAICFLNELLFEGPDYHHSFGIADAHGVLLCKDLEIHVLELSKFDVPVEEVKTPLQRWCYFFKHGASLDLATLPTTLDVPVIRKAVEVLMRISQDELERHRVLERERAERDAASLAADVRVAQEEMRVAQEEMRVAQEEMRVAQEEMRVAQEEKRVAQEKARVAQEKARVAQEKARVGIERGQQIGRVRLLQKLLKQPETSSEELERLEEKDLLRLEESLSQELSGKKQVNRTPPNDKT